MALPTASDNVFPKVTFVEGAAPSSPAATNFKLYFDSADHLLKWKNSAGTVTTIATGTPATVATDPIWDAAGDLAVGTGADTAARLAKGNPGATLAMGNSAVIWNAGTSFPASKATGDRYYRTDSGLEFFWDGTRWKTTTLYSMQIAPIDTTFPATSGFSGRVSLWSSDYEIWLISAYAVTYVSTTNNGSNYWVLSVIGAVTNTTYDSSLTTAADSAGTYTGHKVSLAQTAGSTERGINITWTKAGSPGGIYAPTMITYRLIGV